MVTANQTITIGFLILLIFSSGLYITLSEKARIRIDYDKSVFYVKDSRWVIAGTEYNKMYSGTSLVYRDASKIKIDRDINQNIVTIKRTTPYKNGATIVDTYKFDAYLNNVEFFPVSHTIEIFNGKGYIYQYEVRDLVYSGETKSALGTNEMSFGRNMKVIWDKANYYAQVYKSGVLKIKYKPNSDYVKYDVRLYDPPSVTLNFPGDYYNSTSNIIAFNCTATDALNLVNISIFTNITGQWESSKARYVTSDNSDWIVPIDNLASGDYLWTCIIGDSVLGEVSATENRTFTIEQTTKAITTKLNSSGYYYKIWNGTVWENEVLETGCTINWPSANTFLTADPNNYQYALSGKCIWNGTNWISGGNQAYGKSAFNAQGYGISTGNYYWNGTAWEKPPSGVAFPEGGEWPYIIGADSYEDNIALLYINDKQRKPLTLRIWNGYDYGYDVFDDFEQTIQQRTGGDRGITGDLIYESDGELIVASRPNPAYSPTDGDLPAGNISARKFIDVFYSTDIPTHIPLEAGEVVNKIKLISNGSDILLGSYGNNFYIERWDGSYWQNLTLLDSSTLQEPVMWNLNYHYFDMDYNKDRALIAWVNNQFNAVFYRFWYSDNATLSDIANFTPANGGNKIQVAGDKYGDDFILTVLNESDGSEPYNVRLYVWNGSEWDSGTNWGRAGEWENIPVTYLNTRDRDLNPRVELETPDFGTIYDDTTTEVFSCVVRDDYGIENVTLYSDINDSVWSARASIPVNGSTYYNATFNVSFTHPITTGFYKWNCLATDISGKSASAGIDKTFSVSSPVWDMNDCKTGGNYYGYSSPYNESYVLVGVEYSGWLFDATPSWNKACLLIDNSMNLSTEVKYFSYYGGGTPKTNRALIGVDKVGWDWGFISKWTSSAKINKGVINFRNCYKGPYDYGFTNTFEDVSPYFVAVGAGIQGRSIYWKRNDWTQTCELAQYPIVSVQLIEPPNGTITMDPEIDFTCEAYGTNNIANVTLYIDINGTWEAYDTYDAGGTSTEVNHTWSIALPLGRYHWNCRADDVGGRYGFAPSNWILTRDCVDPVNDLYLNSDTLLCQGTYNLTDTGDTGVIIANNNNIWIGCYNGTTIVGDNSGTGYYINGWNSVEIEGCNIINYSKGFNINAGGNHTLFGDTATLSGGQQGVYVSNSGSIHINNITITSDGDFAGNLIEFSSSDDSLIENSNITVIYVGSTGSFNVLKATSSNNATVFNSTIVCNHKDYEGSAGIVKNIGVYGFKEVGYNAIDDCDFGIYFTGTGSAGHNTLTNHLFGIYPQASAILENNTIADSYMGIWNEDKAGVSISNSSFDNNKFDVFLDLSTNFNQIAYNNNLSNGRGFNYSQGLNDSTVSGLGMFGCYDCHNLIIEDFEGTNNSHIIILKGGENITIRNIVGKEYLANGIYIEDPTNVSMDNININGIAISDPSNFIGPYVGNGVYIKPTANGSISLTNSNIKNFYAGADMYRIFVVDDVEFNDNCKDLVTHNFEFVVNNSRFIGGTMSCILTNEIGMDITAGGTIENNTFEYYYSGQVIEFDDNSTFRNNTIQHITNSNVDIASGGTGNILHTNKFYNMTSSALRVYSISNDIYNNLFDSSLAIDDNNNLNNWNTSYSCSTANIVGGPCMGGNYWWDYNGTDTNGDMIGDTEIPWKGTTSIQQGGDYLPLVYGPNTTIEYSCGLTKLQWRITNLTEQDLEPVGQSSSCPAYNITNTGTKEAVNLYTRLNSTLPAGITMECDDDNGFGSPLTLNTSQQSIWTGTLAINASMGIWCRIDLNNPSSGKIGQVMYELT